MRVSCAMQKASISFRGKKERPRPISRTRRGKKNQPGLTGPSRIKGRGGFRVFVSASFDSNKGEREVASASRVEKGRKD